MEHAQPEPRSHEARAAETVERERDGAIGGALDAALPDDVDAPDLAHAGGLEVDPERVFVDAPFVASELWADGSQFGSRTAP